ncbi:hypothetical protein [Staphylococcus shinii]|uniref:hypothetical protein n=1 Tax=Staphylococcus shinii TaxID=2912228 RepID=UPI003F548F75
MTDVDYPILERYMRNYYSMIDTYKNKANDMDELKYMNLESIVKGITEVFNNSEGLLNSLGGMIRSIQMKS